MPKVDGLDDLKKDVAKLPLKQRVWFRLIIIIIGLVIAGAGYLFTQQQEAPSSKEEVGVPSINIQTGDVTQKQTQKNTQEVKETEEE